MGIFSKLKFWGKDQPDFDTLANQEIYPNRTAPDTLNIDTDPTSLESDPLFPENVGANPFQKSESQEFSTPQQIMPQPRRNTELELIASKLDTIKAMLDSMERRVANIEKTVGNEVKQRLW
ncbi:MAG TPA: hypothetical protein VJI98_03015 [Candidatus Nanoarchaeia archaeon]|nr:hypothetical protein [Candidatus Nanoarchaeia archaeon]